jgi:nucleoside-diphosphate-sugar epimerase
MSELLSLVTGGSGYFGEVLVRKLAGRGQKVRNFDLNPFEASDTPVETVLGDIRDAGAVRAVCRGTRVVYHNVAQVPLAKDRQLFWAVNRDGTGNLLEACLAEGVRKVVVTSSSAVFGAPKSNPITAETEPRPGEDYGRAKLEGERLCGEFAKRGLDVTVIRPRTIVGSGRLGIFQILFEWVRLGRNIPVLGDGSNRYQFIHADDLAEACILAAGRPGPGTYNCGAERFGTMRETLEAVCRHAATGSRVIGLPMGPAIALMKLTSVLGLSPLGAYHSLMYGRSMYFDNSKARSELGWAPRFSSEEMMIESYDWYVQHREEIECDRSARSHHRSPLRQGVLALVSRLL